MPKTLVFRPIDKKRYFEQVADMIRVKIFQESLREGYRLPSEQQLATELNVSRSVVREALRILDVMGYVEIKKGPQGGIFVSSLYHKPLSDSFRNLAELGQITVDHLFDVRLHVEPMIVAEAVKYASDEDIKKLVDLMKDAGEHLDEVAYLKQKSIEFHFLLAEASGNPVLSILMKSLIEILLEVAYSFLDPVFEKQLYHVHSNLLEAIKNRKIEEATRLIHDDILFVKDNLKKYLKKPKAQKPA
jgi:DNA-binding FadR family transcriptional regulator